MSKLTQINFVATKTIQEKQYEPIKLTVGATATIEEGDNPVEVMKRLRGYVNVELDKGFRSRVLTNEERAQRLQELKRQRDRMDVALQKGDPGLWMDPPAGLRGFPNGDCSDDEENFWNLNDPTDLG